MLQRIRVARRGESGASAAEYALLVVAIAALIVLVVFFLGGLIRDAFDDCDDAASRRDPKVAERCANR